MRGLIGKFLGGLVGSFLAKLAELRAVFRAGADHQANKDSGAVLSAGKTRADVDNEVGGASGDALRGGLLADSADREQ